MKWFFYSLIFLIISVIALIIMAPLSFVLERARIAAPALEYVSAKGTIWNGEVRQLRYGLQPVGDVKLKTNWSALLGGNWKSELRVSEGGIVASATAKVSIGGSLTLSDVRMAGRTSDLMSLRQEVRDLDGEFRMSLNELKIKSGQCVSGRGTVWTDTLVKFEQAYDWKGPELDGTISCEQGQIVVRMTGEAETGETINAELFMGLNASGRFRAVIENPTEKTAQAATLLGFLTEGDRMIYEHNMVRSETGIE